MFSWSPDHLEWFIQNTYVFVRRLYSNSNLSLFNGSSYRKGKLEVTCEVRGLPSSLVVFGWFRLKKELCSDRLGTGSVSSCLPPTNPNHKDEWLAAPREEDDQIKWNWISAGAQVVPGQRVTGKIKEGMSQLSKQEWLGIWVVISICWWDRVSCLLDFSLTANFPKFDSYTWPKVPLLLQTTCPPSRSRLSGGRRCSVMLRWFPNSEETCVFFSYLDFQGQHRWGAHGVQGSAYGSYWCAGNFFAISRTFTISPCQFHNILCLSFVNNIPPRSLSGKKWC